MQPLSSAQRASLRSQAHHLHPLVQIGKQGLTQNVIASVDVALTAHELIKVKFGEFKDEKRELSEQLAEAVGAHVAGIIGNIAILYRPHPDRDKRKIRLDAYRSSTS